MFCSLPASLVALQHHMSQNPLVPALRIAYLQILQRKTQGAASGLHAFSGMGMRRGDKPAR